MTTAQWFTEHEDGGFPIDRAALGSCDLSVLHVGGEWQWLVQQAGRDVAEGAARTADDARREAIAAAVALELDPEMAFLTRIDPTRNINRFYVVQVMPSLFGDWTVLREWGRRGSPGTVRLSSYQRRNEADIAEQRTIQRRLQHGYFQSQPARG